MAFGDIVDVRWSHARVYLGFIWIGFSHFNFLPCDFDSRTFVWLDVRLILYGVALKTRLLNISYGLVTSIDASPDHGTAHTGIVGPHGAFHSE